MPYMVIGMTAEEGMEGVYKYDDCLQYIAEQSECCIGTDIIPNPYYKNNIL